MFLNRNTVRAYNLRSALQKPEFITGLYLNRMELKAVPPEVFRLPNLRELDLSGNEIAALPGEIGQLARLEKLVLSGNAIEALPPALGRLRFLREVHLANNRITIWPEILQNISGLEVLNLAGNQLDVLPEAAGSLPALKSLDLAGNRLKKLPPTVRDWSELRTLSLRQNQLGRLPVALCRCRRLDHLDLSGNRLRTLPANFAELDQLRLLDISANRFADLPAPLFACKHLRRLVAAANRVDRLPPGIGELSWLMHLDLRRNKLQSLPESLTRCRQLQVLLLERNELEALPSLAPLVRLRQLDLAHNRLKTWPSLPQGMKILKISRNELASVPHPLGDLHLLEELDLSYNPVSSLPESLVRLKQLRKLNLRKTSLRKWPVDLLALDRLRSLKTDWPAADERAFLRLLRVCVKKEAPVGERLALYRLLDGGTDAARTLTLWLLFLAANLKHRELRRLARAELLRRYGQPEASPALGDSLCVLGKTAQPYRQLAGRLHAQGIALATEVTAETNAILLGEYPQWSPALETFDGVFLTESQLVAWLDEREERHLLTQAGPEQIERLRALLLHRDPANVQLAVQMMRGGGVPAELLTELLIAWKRARPGKGRRALKQLLWQYAPEPARRALEMPLSLSPQQPEALLRANIARVCAGTPFMAEKLLRAVRERG